MSLQAARRRKQATFRWVVVGLVLTFFALPLFGMLEFTTRGAGGSGRSLDTWAKLVDFGTIDALGRSLFTDYVVPFELSSALLMIAIILASRP